VRVAVPAGPRETWVRDRIASIQALARARVIAGLALIVVVVGVGGVAIGALRGGRTGASSGAVVAGARAAGPAGVAAAYRYPLDCLGVTISATDPAYASARLDRASPCWRYGAYVTAIFHRVNGVWHLALKAASSSCRAVSLPAAVLAQLAICQVRLRPLRGSADR